MSRFGLIVFLTLLTTSASFACSVPVCRYALEHWHPARYDLIVYHRGTLTPADRDALHRIESAVRGGNVRVVDADLDGSIDANLRSIWERDAKDQPLPRVILRFPESGPKIPSVWTGPLSTDPAVLFSSPARSGVFDRLTAGYAGTVILLLSGDVAQDDAARAFLKRELPRIAQQIKLPAPTDEGPQIMSELPVRIEFPVVEVERNREEFLTRLLLNSEVGLSVVRGPIVFPVFGRGRALCSVHDKDLRDPIELQRSLEFLCRECSCQVKELNPGVDLLIAGNWDIIFEAERGPPPRTIAVAAENRPAEKWDAASMARSPPPAGYEAAEIEADTTNPHRRSALLRFGIAAGFVLVLVTGYWAMRGRRDPPAS
ncbi:MAG TPA: hypothetical protein VHR66_02800 [Gemmataceae bacterium]|jgi:hypothetical protein|nr:hypothetical protein [Gemmataceae bacterium]